MATTTNYSWILPTVTGDTGAWGTILNTAISAIDAALKLVSNVANAALAKAGGTMSGNLKLLTSSAVRVDLGPISGAHEFDLAVAQSYTFTVAGDLTITFVNAPAGVVTSACMFAMTNAGAHTITWPTVTPVMKWTGGVAPTWTVSGSDRVAFITDDAGVTAHGIVMGKDYKVA